MSEVLFAPFAFPFMQNAFLICLLVAIPTALLSCFLVLKGWALMGDAISHAVLPGIVLAFLAGIPLLIGAFVAGMFCAIASGYLSDNSRVKEDTVLGVVFSGMFGLGLVLYASVDTNVHLDHILFGNLLGVDQFDLLTTGMISTAISALIFLKWKDILLHSFDPIQAKASGLPVLIIHYGLLAAISLTVVATLSAAGLILAIGLLITPGAIAYLISRSFAKMILTAIATNLCAMLGGVYLSFFIDSAPAPTIILVLTVLFVIAFVFKMWRTKRASSQVFG